MRRLSIVLATVLPALLAGCDLLGIEGAGAVAAKREAEGKAIGGACRHAARSIEQCYASNKRADKAAVFAGWREMNDYMRENKIDAMPAPDPPPAPAADGEAEEEAPATSAAGKKPGAKAAAPEGAKPGGGKAAAARPQ
jgi:hypothetical protein